MKTRLLMILTALLMLGGIDAKAQYYWYVGITEPTSSTNPVIESGWTELSSKPDCIVVDAEDPAWNDVQWYLAAPAEWNFDTTFNGVQVGGWIYSTVQINGIEYSVWKGGVLTDAVHVTLSNVGGSTDPTGYTKIAEKDWSGVKDSDLPWIGFANPANGSAAGNADGIEITVTEDVGELWQPQAVILDGFDLKKDTDYKVVVTAKMPCDGQLQINMGDWDNYSTDYAINVKSTGKFQEIEFDFPQYESNVTNARVLFQCGNFVGTSIVKNVKVYMKDDSGTDVKTYALIYKVDGEEYKTYSLKEGDAITPESAPTKDGYEFSGWSEIPKYMPGNDLTIVGSFDLIADYDEIKIGSTGKATFSSKYDLDFSAVEGLKAYTATGYENEDATVWLSRVLRVPAGTGLMVKGDAGTYKVPHTTSASYYTNLFKANTGGQISIGETDGEWTNYYLSGGQFKKVNGNANIGHKKCYLQLPSRFFSKTRSIEVVYDDEEATGIMDNGQWIIDKDSDAWYNINGQRISQPTKKGLYIHNGLKVVIR